MNLTSLEDTMLIFLKPIVFLYNSNKILKDKIKNDFIYYSINKIKIKTA